MQPHIAGFETGKHDWREEEMRRIAYAWPYRLKWLEPRFNLFNGGIRNVGMAQDLHDAS